MHGAKADSSWRSCPKTSTHIFIRTVTLTLPPALKAVQTSLHCLSSRLIFSGVSISYRYCDVLQPSIALPAKSSAAAAECGGIDEERQCEGIIPYGSEQAT